MSEPDSKPDPSPPMPVNGMETSDPPGGAAAQGRDVPERFAPVFVKEVVILCLGLVIGFFWGYYFEEVERQEVHVIMILLIVVLCLTRFIYYIIRR